MGHAEVCLQRGHKIEPLDIHEVSNQTVVCLNDKKAGKIRTSLASAGEARYQPSIKMYYIGW